MVPVDSEILYSGMCQVQGIKSETFTPLPFGNQLTLPEAIDFHMIHSANHPVMVWSREDRGEEIETITWSHYSRAIHRIARKIAKKLGYNLDNGERPPKDTFVAIMASGDFQTYLALVLGIVRAGCVVFPLSTNNSLAATVYLLKAKNCSLLVGNRVGTVPHLEKVVQEALKEVPCKLFEWIRYEEVFADDEGDNYKPLPVAPKTDDLLSPVLAFHSSGSTSFPKPIIYTHLSLLYQFTSFNYNQWQFTNRVIFLGHLPPFHVMSALMGLAGAIGASLAMGLFSPRFPPNPPNPTSTLQAASHVASWLVSPPVFLQIWSQDEESMNLLRGFDRVSFGGGPLHQKVGKDLISQGVKLHTLYSSTEMGNRIQFDIYDDPNLWDWNKNIPTILTFFRPMEDVVKSGHHELLVAATDRYMPNVINDEYQGTPVYATNDLVELHQNDPTLFRVVGRKDDQIMLESGEKTNPSPLQPMIEKSKFVKSCLYFGRGKPHNGILVEPMQEVDVKDEVQVAHFRNLIWKEVEEANGFAPSHSRVFKEMIVIGTPAKPFQRTAKGSLRSGIILQVYEEEIETAYTALKNSSILAERVTLPSLWDVQQTLAFVRTIISTILERESMEEEQDIFASYGADSLAATRIRNSISASLEKSKEAGVEVRVTRLPTDIVYRHSTIKSLAIAVVSLLNGIEDHAAGNMIEDRVAAMEAMVSKYSQNWPARGGKTKANDHSRGKVALITGTTGGLGSHTLEKLIRAKNVTMIWALNRVQSGETPLHRHRKSFIERGLNADLLLDSKVRLLEADLQSECLGLSDVVYEEIVSSVTVIYHIAWRLDFNLSLASYEEHIRGTRHLLDVALHSMAPLLFTSSIAVTARAGHYPVKEAPLPFSASVGLGYGESKAVTERLLERAQEETGLKTCSVRIGQLSGSTTNGYWATTDWVPIMVKSAIALRKIPTAHDRMTWIPTDTCAATLLELKLSGSTRHIIHPTPIEWNSIIHDVAEMLQLEITSFPQWIDDVEKASLDADLEIVDKIPAIELFDFFQRQFNSAEKSEPSAVPLDCTRSLEESKSLQNATPLSRRDVEQWISYWRSKCFC